MGMTRKIRETSLLSAHYSLISIYSTGIPISTKLLRLCVFGAGEKCITEVGSRTGYSLVVPSYVQTICRLQPPYTYHSIRSELVISTIVKKAEHVGRRYAQETLLTRQQ